MTSNNFGDRRNSSKCTDKIKYQCQVQGIRYTTYILYTRNTIMSPVLPSLLLPLLLIPSSFARQITVKNSCSSTIWPGMHTGGSIIPDQATGWELAAGGQTKFTVPEDWTAGRIWARSGCVVQDGAFQCLTGQCGSGENGDVTCENSDQPPATLAEFTLIPGGEDNYDISLVDGFNIPLNIIPSISTCAEPQCQVNINALCPPLLRTSFDQNGVNLGCIAPCNRGFGQELYGNRACCTGAYADSVLCLACGVDYYALFKDNCNTSYAYAYDEKSHTALWTCGGSPDYTVEFCPAGSDYVGAKEASNEYVDATATCSSMAITFSTTFNVGPSPTSIATIGKLDVVATVATGADGAAAIQISEAGAASSGATTIATTATATQTAVGVVAQTMSSSARGATSAQVQISAVIAAQSSAGTFAAAATVTSAAAYLEPEMNLVAETTVAKPTTTIIITEYIIVPSSDGSDFLAVQTTSAAEGQGYTSVEIFTVYGGSTLYEVIHGIDGGGSEATNTAGGMIAMQASRTSAEIAGSTDTEPGNDMPWSGHRWGEGNWLSAIPTGASDNSLKKRVSLASMMMMD
ncbi:thaumatin family protein [Cryptococcus neoformans Gb118]|nr:thaumatin family protein [Cryptococcus neoformans var. grubii MW-RSA36]OXL08134.1 thaumatin family protein [Cryptococcus neoformans var. grubii Gb118]